LDTFLSIALGIGLSAACGFRIFVPLLALSLASYANWITLSGGFEWIGTLPAVIAFGTATVFEVAAYYIPWFDNAMDTIATPVAVVAGVITSFSVFGEMDPVMKWSLALIGGGGAAGLIQGATSLLRLKSTVTTLGLGNPVVATFELISSALTSVLALIMPLFTLVVLILLCVFVYRVAGKLLFGRRHHPQPS